jgi:large subunit ribosomal protein L21
MKAIIKTGGKQYIVSEGDTISIEKIKDVNVNDEISFDQILLTFNNGDVNIGNPVVANAQVKGKVLEIKKGKKVTLHKFKNKVRYRKTIGHRQIKAKVQITTIA